MRARLLLPLIPLVVATVVFGPSVGYRFVGWDDDIHVYQNPYLSPPSFANTLQFWKGPHQALYMPVTFSAWSLITRLAQAAAAPEGRTVFAAGAYHAANLLVHLLTVLTVYFLLLRLLSGSHPDGSGQAQVRPGSAEHTADGIRAQSAALLGALLYAVHPLQVEPVSWVSSLKDLLSGYFSALALLCFVCAYRLPDFSRGNDRPGEPRRKNSLFLGASLFFVLAILSKPAAVVVPALAWLMVIWLSYSREPPVATARRLLPPPLLLVWLVLALPIMVMAKVAEADIPLGEVAPFFLRPLVALDALAFYLGKVLVPLSLGIDYGRTTAWVTAQGWIRSTWIFPVLLSVVLVIVKDRRWLIALALFAVGAAPTLGLVPHGYQVFSNVADRFLYIAMLGPALAFAWGALAVSSRRRLLLALPIVVWCVLSFVQRGYWADNVSLFRHALLVNDRSYMAHYNLGITLSDGGSAEPALEHYRAAVRIKPDYARAYNNLGALLEVRGRHEEAIAAYRTAGRLTPSDPKVPYNLGLSLAALGRTDEAIAAFEEALRLRPDYSEAHSGLGSAYGRKGDGEKAAFHYREAIRANPGSFAAWNNLGIQLADRLDAAGAVAAYRGAIRANPGYPDAYSNLGNALVSLGKIDEALAAYREAIRLKPDYAMAHNNLGTAFARLGKFAEARESFQRALQLDPDCHNAGINLSRLPAGQ
jgi:tetratricopeptide (TPR) repeat protein